MMDFWRFMGGMLEVELTSAEIGSALQAINEKNIPIYQVQQISDLTTVFRINRRDFYTLGCLAEKRGDHLRLHNKSGLYRAIQGLWKRPVLLFGIVLLLYLAMVFPTKVMFVQVEGNVRLPDNQILSAAEDCGIRFWAARREVRSERVKNALLSTVPELQWVGVNTHGCVAVISVQERREENRQEKDHAVGSIVAARDGVIDSCTATRGNMLCYVGQAVKEGQVLISGYTDCGICIQATRAEGEVYGQTRRELCVITLAQYRIPVSVQETKRKYSLIIGKKRINLWKDSGIWDASCGRMYEEYYITLPGGFRLPAALAVESYHVREFVCAEQDMEDSLAGYARTYLLEQMVAGQILDASFWFTATEDVLFLKGSFLCREMIGRVQQEKIGE